jgi:hypothetical protein
MRKALANFIIYALQVLGRNAAFEAGIVIPHRPDNLDGQSSEWGGLSSPGEKQVSS